MNYSKPKEEIISSLIRSAKSSLRAKRSCVLNLGAKRSKKKLLILFLVLVSNMAYFSQELKGVLPAHQFQTIKLYSYQGFGSLLQDSSVVDSTGHFKLRYTFVQLGMGYLQTADQSILPIVLQEKSFALQGEHLQDKEQLKFTNSTENSNYYHYLQLHNERDGLLSGWKYLLQQYQQSPTYSKAQNDITLIKEKIAKLMLEDSLQIAKMKASPFAKYIIPIQNLVQSVATTAKYYPQEIPQKVAQFRAIDYTNSYLYHSGLLNDVLEAHYWLIENSGKPLDSVFIEMNKSTDYLLESLQKDEKILNEVTDYLFDLLEKHSLFKASEYLALKVLTQNSCTINNDLANQLETYRAMKIGNTAKDIEFSGVTVQQGAVITKYTKLSDIQSDYKLVMFGASWCPKCVEELPKVGLFYKQWKQKRLEVIYVSLDSDAKKYLNFVKYFPFISTCDFKQWETQAAKDYYVFSTPTLFLLDKNNKIILRPNSIKQVEAWVKFNL